ncbi:acylphosphatase-2 isoform X1 [Cygnus atratus]|uniref:acylphosphatase-2 isoform X1 n=1 Tax=Cygnus atratus TaxID=8868 RepID=UPI0021B7CFFF|nr:acylphosphatase-2 isoform X1 [Cygnus atratus]
MVKSQTTMKKLHISVLQTLKYRDLGNRDSTVSEYNNILERNTRGISALGEGTPDGWSVSEQAAPRCPATGLTPCPGLGERKSWLTKVGSPSSRIDRTNFSNEKEISKLDFSGFSTRY